MHKSIRKKKISHDLFFLEAAKGVRDWWFHAKTLNSIEQNLPGTDSWWSGVHDQGERKDSYSVKVSRYFPLEVLSK